MANDEIYERLSLLFDRLSISHPDGSEEKGELMAYCTAIDLVNREMEDCFNQIFVDTASGLGLSLFCELFKIDSSLSEEEKRSLIKQGLSQQYGDYIFGTLKSEIERLGDDFSVTAEDFSVTVNGSVTEDFSLLSAIGKIMEEYIPPCTTAVFSGDGMDFDYWDSTPYLFEDYDNLRMSFALLDTLN